MLKKVPELMFRSTPKSRQPDAEAVSAALECFGAVEEVEVLPNNQSAGAGRSRNVFFTDLSYEQKKPHEPFLNQPHSSFITAQAFNWR